MRAGEVLEVRQSESTSDGRLGVGDDADPWHGRTQPMLGDDRAMTW